MQEFFCCRPSESDKKRNGYTQSGNSWGIRPYKMLSTIYSYFYHIEIIQDIHFTAYFYVCLLLKAERRETNKHRLFIHITK